MRLNRAACLVLAALALLLAVPRADARQLREESGPAGSAAAGAPAPAPLASVDPGAVLTGTHSHATTNTYGCTRQYSVVAACTAQGLGAFCGELSMMLGELCTGHMHVTSAS